MNAVTVAPSAAVVEQVLIKGDLSSLTPTQRAEYYSKVCESVGLNPMTKPFEYITLNGKLTLYALRACTDQLRSIYAVSVEDLAETERDGVFIVTAKVKNGQGRTDIAKGAVSIGGLKGEALANALMKAETKAKRRATLSICGLGWLDESEVDSIPGAVRGEPVIASTAPSPPPAPPPAPSISQSEAPKMSAEEWTTKALDRIKAITTFDGLTDFENRFEAHLVNLKEKQPELHKQIIDAMQIKSFDLG